MKIRLLSNTIALCALLTAASIPAAAFQDLGQGLLYLRVSSIPADIPGSTDARIAAASIIIDLRGAKADATGAALLSSWLGFRCNPSHPTLVLLNHDTSATLINAALYPTRLNLLSLAPTGCPFTPDILVETDISSDRSACEAIARGNDIAALTALKARKDRRDEAKLQKSYEEGIRVQGRNAESASAPGGTQQQAAEPETPRDLVLARALHVHRALLALRLR